MVFFFFIQILSCSVPEQLGQIKLNRVSEHVLQNVQL